MFAKLFSIPNLFTWLFAAASLATLAGAYFAQSSVDEFAKNGADTTATITKKFSRMESTSGNSRIKRRAYIINYDYELPNGRKISSFTRMEETQWDRLSQGARIPIRYLLTAPEKHQTHLQEYSQAVDLLMVFTWLFAGIAALLMLFDIRQAIPAISTRLGAMASLFLFLCILSIAGASLLRWSLTRHDATMATTTGTVIKKEIARKDDNTARASSDRSQVNLLPTQFNLRYQYVADTGEKHEFAKPVDETLFEDHAVGDTILVRYSLNDTSVHDIRSGALLNAADGWVIIGGLFGLIGLGLAIRDWRRTRRQSSTKTSGAPAGGTNAT